MPRSNVDDRGLPVGRTGAHKPRTTKDDLLKAVTSRYTRQDALPGLGGDDAQTEQELPPAVDSGSGNAPKEVDKRLDEAPLWRLVEQWLALAETVGPTSPRTVVTLSTFQKRLIEYETACRAHHRTGDAAFTGKDH
jgi:hypothetical protein